MDPTLEPAQGVSRRTFLSAFGVAAGAAVLVAHGLPLSAAEAADLPRWSQPATWGAAGVPGPGSVVLLEQPVLLDVDATVARLQIAPGGALHFDPDSSRTLTSTGNVVVEGLLQMRPRSAAVKHLLRFTGVDEARFVGGGMDVLESDTGLWVTGGGLLDLVGAPRLAWARTVAGVEAGTRTLTLAADPTGWQVGDELAITPTAAPTATGASSVYDVVTVAAVSGRTVTLSRPTSVAHPAVTVGPGMVLTPEVLNLTRNVGVEGQPGHRVHVTLLRATSPQSLAYLGLRHVGPRQPDGAYTGGVLGRYGLHFHMMGDASRGSSVTGAVVRDAGHHSFVAHGSHGITMTSCIAHDVVDEAYWYDGMVDTRTGGADTHDWHLQGCVASLVRCDPAFRGFRLNGFTLGAGSGNQALDCVAVGVQGTTDAAGFSWPENPVTGVWRFEGSVAHNNAVNGLFTWQNTEGAHVVKDFVSYHNGGAGIAHGAYLTTYTYENAYLYGNRLAAVDLHSNSYPAPDKAQLFLGLHCDGAGLARHAVRLMKHQLPGGQPNVFRGCTFRGQTGPAVAAVYDLADGPTTLELVDLVDCTSTTPLLWLRDDTEATSVVRVQSGAQAWTVRPKGGPGTLRPEWNAAASPASPFSTAAVEQVQAFAVAAGAPALAALPVPRASEDTYPAGTPTETALPVPGPSVSAPASEMPGMPGMPPSPTAPATSVPAPSTSVPTERPTSVPSPVSSPAPTHTTPAPVATPPKPPAGAFTARLSTRGRVHTLTLVNRDSRACMVEVLRDGKVIKRAGLKKGTSRVSLKVLRGTHRLSARCHGAGYSWVVRG